MKIMKIKNVENFMKMINECSGDVFLETNEGDCLNLKSKLTQFLTLSKVFSAESSVGEFQIKASKNDLIKIAEYLVNE